MVDCAVYCRSNCYAVPKEERVDDGIDESDRARNDGFRLKLEGGAEDELRNLSVVPLKTGDN